MKTIAISQSSTRTSVRMVRLTCGILSSAWLIGINIYVPMQYEGYSLSELTISELSAIDAPTRELWLLLALPYPILFGAFGWGVIQCAGKNRALRVVGVLTILYAILNLYWPPMHQRGVAPTLTDTLHITWAAVSVLLMWAVMGFGAASFGIRFRIYTLSSITLHIVFGILTSLDAPNIPTNGPTPWIGIWERINISIFLIWVIVLALLLWRRESAPVSGTRNN